MSAQKELATLLAAPDEAHALFSGAALKFLRDHGPAIAELIEACKEFVDDQELMSHARIAAALRKLTQEA